MFQLLGLGLPNFWCGWVAGAVGGKFYEFVFQAGLFDHQEGGVLWQRGGEIAYGLEVGVGGVDLGYFGGDFQVARGVGCFPEGDC